MFDIGFPELMLVAVVVLLVLGPERLPEALRTAGLWIGRLQRSFTNVKTEIEREIGMDDIRRQLHNESVMAEMRKLEQDLKSNSDPRLNPTLTQTPGGAVDSNSILPEDSLGLDPDADDPTVAQSETAAQEADPAPAEPESEAATVERLQREAAAETSNTEATATHGGSQSDDEQRA